MSEIPYDSRASTLIFLPREGGSSLTLSGSGAGLHETYPGHEEAFIAGIPSPPTLGEGTGAMISGGARSTPTEG